MRQLAFAAIGALLIAPLIAQQPGAPESPVFRAGAHLVEISVAVRQRDRKSSAADLAKDDFIIAEGGKRHKVSVFTPVTGQRAVAANPQPELAPNVFSNRGGMSSEQGTGSQPSSPGAVTVILIDRLNTLRGTGTQPYEETAAWKEDGALANARQQLMKFVNTLDPHSRVAIYSLGKTLTVLSDFTGNREQLRAALDKDRANLSIYQREDVDPHSVHTPVPDKRFDASIDHDRLMMASFLNRDRSQMTMGALVSIAAHVTGIPGRKSLVWLTANLPFSLDAASRALSRANVAVYPMDARGLLTSDTLGRNTDLAYDPTAIPMTRGGTPSIPQGTQPVGDSTMEVLALETGGRAFVNLNDMAGGIRQIVEDDSSVYKLGFYLDEGSLDGKFHKLEIRIKHGKFDVRAPRGYFAARDQSMTGRDRVLEAMATPLESSAIGLTAGVERVTSASLAISGFIHLEDLRLEQQADGWKGAFEIYTIEQDVTGGLIGEFRQRFNLQLTRQMRDEYLQSGLPFRQMIKPKDGLVTLRVLVVDPNGSNIGSLIIPVEKFKH